MNRFVITASTFEERAPRIWITEDVYGDTAPATPLEEQAEMVQIRRLFITGSSLHTGTPSDVADMDLVARLLNVALRIRSVLRHYVVPAPSPVIEFLQSRIHLVDILDAAWRAIPMYFHKASAQLDLVRDDEEAWERLYLTIKVPLGVEDLLRQADRFHEEWVSPRIENFGCEFTITEEPI
jgi:hypothetical protein